MKTGESEGEIMLMHLKILIIDIERIYRNRYKEFLFRGRDRKINVMYCFNFPLVL